MAIVTTYVCDISGKQSSNRGDFVDVSINTTGRKPDNGNDYSGKTISKLISREVAVKLNLVALKSAEEAQPEVTFESKLTALLKDYISDLVVDEVSDQISHRS